MVVGELAALARVLTQSLFARLAGADGACACTPAPPHLLLQLPLQRSRRPHRISDQQASMVFVALLSCGGRALGQSGKSAMLLAFYSSAGLLLL